MIINQKISNLKENGVEFTPVIYRFVKSAMLQTIYNSDNEIIEVVVTCDVHHYTNSELTQFWKIKPRKVVNLLIKNEFIIDKTTGVRANDSTSEENKMGELTYFVDYLQGAPIRQLVIGGVLLSDSNGRFD